jgi:hypothetical protein
VHKTGTQTTRFHKKIHVHTDALSYGARAILLQESTKATTWKLKQHLITYYSATFILTERNYNVYKQELLAILKALDHWKAYLKMTAVLFTIVPDHANLTYWKSTQKLN